LKDIRPLEQQITPFGWVNTQKLGVLFNFNCMSHGTVELELVSLKLQAFRLLVMRHIRQFYKSTPLTLHLLLVITRPHLFR